MAIKIIKQPMDVYGLVNAAVSVSVNAIGDNLTYRWQFKEGEGNWRNSLSSGANTDTLIITMTTTWDNCGLRCVITDASGKTITSDEVKVNLGYPVTSLAMPDDTNKYPIRDANAITQNDLNGAVYEALNEPMSDVDTIEGVGYSVGVAGNSAKIELVGGRTQKWNQKRTDEYVTQEQAYGIARTGSATKCHFSGTATQNIDNGLAIARNININTGFGHKMFAQVIGNIPSGCNLVAGNTLFTGLKGIGVYDNNTGLGITIVNGMSFDTDIWGYVIDLTEIYGAGNEPTSVDDERIKWLEAYALAHPEFDSGSLVSAKVDKIVGKSKWASVDLGTLNWVEGAVYGGIERRFYTNDLNGKAHMTAETSKFIGSCDKYQIVSNEQMYGSSSATPMEGIAAASIAIVGTRFYVFDRSKSSLNSASFKKAMQGVILYYEVSDVEYADTLGTYPIPSEIQQLDGYGLSVSDDCYNYIDFEHKKFVKKVSSVDLGTLTWTYRGADTGYTGTFSTSNIRDYAFKSGVKVLCDNYEFKGVGGVKWASNNGNKTCAIFYSSESATINDRYFYVRNDNYHDAASFKSAMSGVQLIYELATPEEIDISQYISNDIYIEADGSMIYNSDSGLAVPYKMQTGIISKLWAVAMDKGNTPSDLILTDDVTGEQYKIGISSGKFYISLVNNAQTFSLLSDDIAQENVENSNINGVDLSKEGAEG